MYCPHCRKSIPRYNHPGYKKVYPVLEYGQRRDVDHLIKVVSGGYRPIRPSGELGHLFDSLDRVRGYVYTIYYKNHVPQPHPSILQSIK